MMKLSKLSPLFFAMFKWLLAVIVFVPLVSCGGGGGGGGTTTGSSSDAFTLSTTTLNFAAETPAVVTDSQTITGTVNGNLSGVLYITIVASGDAVRSISNVDINPATQSGTAAIYPAYASSLGPGTYTSKLTIRACLNDVTCSTGELSGSPQIVNVNYEVKSSVKSESVMPHTVKANVSDSAVIRGFNFLTDGINKVTFNSTDASSFTVFSETEIHASYPPLTAGIYSVGLSNNAGPTTFSGSLMVVDTVAFTAAAVPYSSTQQTLTAIYDEEREALLVAASYFDGFNFNTASRLGNKIFRYQFSNGSYASVDSATVPLLQGMALSPDRSELIAITDKEVIHFDPVTLNETNSTTFSSTISSNYYFKDIVIANDGNALLTTGMSGSGSTPTYIYPIADPEIYRTNNPCTYYGTSGFSSDGSMGIFIQGGLSPEPPICSYESSVGYFAETLVHFNQVQCMNSSMGQCIHPVLDRTGSLIAVTDKLKSVYIYNSSYSLLGKLPITTEAVVLNDDETRLYAYDPSGSLLRVFDMTAPTDINYEFQEIGSGTSLSGSPGLGVLKMVLSADGGTLFIAGSDQLIIQPVP